jgi:hypothetical protein
LIWEDCRSNLCYCQKPSFPLSSRVPTGICLENRLPTRLVFSFTAFGLGAYDPVLIHCCLPFYYPWRLPTTDVDSLFENFFGKSMKKREFRQAQALSGPQPENKCSESSPYFLDKAQNGPRG